MNIETLVTDGQLGQRVTESNFAKWRTFLIGGVAKTPLIRLLKSKFRVSSYATDLMKSSQFETQDAEESIDTIVLTPADFGYKGTRPTTAELLDPARLAEWSAQNAERLDGYVVELLPITTGPHIRFQYKDQPNGEFLWIAMERIIDSGSHCIFEVKTDSDGKGWLDAGWADPSDLWDMGDSFVFRLRKVTRD